MSDYKYSTVVIGSGISGLYTALKTEELTHNKVLVITKSGLGESNSYYAQGGMVAVLKDNKNDTVESHIKDTLVAGAGLSEIDTVRFISENSDKVVKDLLNFGVEFDRDDKGHYTLTKEAAHSVNRILHSGGDATGREMEIALCNAVKNNKNIDVFENTMATELCVENGICSGVVVLKDNEYKTISANIIVVATGGLGQIYKYTTNPVGATGDGIALCYRAGAVLRDMEFVQFHPTALAIDDNKNHNRFLISEAVRGEGAKLCDKNGFYYMKKYDEREELAPRDIVARSNFMQMKETNTDCVFLNATIIGKDKLLKRFPTIAKKCLENNIDITKDYIPVAPAAHYFMGGVKVDKNGETSVKNLYAVGEVASTGLHGANRLASNSLLECVVCAYKIAEVISKMQNNTKFTDIEYTINNQKPLLRNVLPVKQKLQTIMWDNVGIYRSEQSLKSALSQIELMDNFEQCKSVDEYELKNMITVSRLIIKSALDRKESRGAHYRTDYLHTDNNAKHSEMKQ